jgi:hypothetical protein
MRRRGAALAAVLLALLLVPAAAAGAGTNQVETPGPNELTEAQAIRVARGDAKVRKETRENGVLTPTAELKDEKWGVGWFSDGEEVALVYIDPHSGEVEESWTGYQVAWEMARGYPGAFAHKFDAVWIFVPFCLFFLLGLVDWKRLWRVANLDLAMLLGFVASFYFFNRGNIGVSVPLQYPPLVYFLCRCLWIGFKGRGEGLRPIWPATWLLVAALFLMGVRVGLNMADAGAIDVGYAGVVGADKIAHGEAIYGNFPEDIHSGDTYGPVNYFAYLPFERIWPYSGEWDDLPAAHGASVAFDLLTFGFLILLGLRIRPGPEGKRLAAILAFGWAAYPYTGYVLESDSNDALIAALLVATLLLMAKPLARGATLALATWAKFVPAVLAPMFLTYETRRRTQLLFFAGFAAITVAFMTWPAIDPGLKTFWERSVGAQTGRSSPFSVWGQVSALEPLRDAILVGTAALAVFLAFRPRRKSLLQVSALSAALLLGVQLTLHHWFYLYIVWWFPLLLFALATLRPGTEPGPAGGDSDPRRLGDRVPSQPEEEPAASPA